MGLWSKAVYGGYAIVAAAYDSYDYPSYWLGREYEHECETLVINNFFKKIGKDKKVIDIGAGYGRLVKIYEPYSKKITLVEPSKNLLKRAKTLLSARNGKVNYINCCLENLSSKLNSKKYDVAILVRVMHHIKNPEIAIKTASKLLPKGGYLILEFANKIHGKELIKNLLCGNLTFPIDLSPNDKRSKKNKKKNFILFLNHHPDKIESSLMCNGFKIIDKRSVSNMRSNNLKSILPFSVLILIEKVLQKPLAKLNFGPSIFILAKKK